MHLPPGDLVLLHDPQTAGLAEALRNRGLHVAWRCHVRRDVPDEVSTSGWDFLRPFLAPAELFVFSRRAYAPESVDPAALVVILSIDPFSRKNVHLSTGRGDRLGLLDPLRGALGEYRLCAAQYRRTKADLFAMFKSDALPSA